MGTVENSEALSDVWREGIGGVSHARELCFDYNFYHPIFLNNTC